VAGGPTEERRLSTHLLRDNWAKCGDPAVETFAEIITDNKERAFRDSRGVEHGVFGRIVFLLDGTTAYFGKDERLASLNIAKRGRVCSFDASKM
jgi:hypothetical protein